MAKKFRVGSQVAALALVLAFILVSVSGSGVSARGVSPDATASLGPDNVGTCIHDSWGWDASWGSIPPYRDVIFTYAYTSGGWSYHYTYATSKSWWGAVTTHQGTFYPNLYVQDGSGGTNASVTTRVSQYFCNSANQ